MPSKTYQITGHIIDSKTKQGIAGLKVEAWDKDEISKDESVGCETTYVEGRFKIQFTEDHFKDLFEDKYPDLYFKIYDGEKLIKSTEDSVLWNVKDEVIDVGEIEVDFIPPEQIYKVRGRVLYPDGTPAVGVTVKAFDVRLQKKEVLLHETITDDTGHYEIIYLAGQFQAANKAKPDLVIRVSVPSAETFSKVIYNAKQVETVDLIVGNAAYRGPAEHKQITDTITPLRGGIPLHELQAEDINFLSNKTGIDVKKSSYLVRAADLADKKNLDQNVLYALFNQNLPTSLPALISQCPEVIHNALKTAVNNNVIPPVSDKILTQTFKRIKELVIENAFNPLEPLPPGRTSLGKLLNTVPQLTNDMTKQKKFLELYIGHEGTIKHFWEQLRNDPDFKEPGLVDDLKLTVQLGVLTNNHLPLVQELKNKKLSSLLDLVRWKAKDWIALINNGVGTPPDMPGKDEETKIKNYAKTMVRMLEDAFPMDMIVIGVEQDGNIQTPLKQDLLQFFNDNPDFNFSTSQIDEYLPDNPGMSERISYNNYNDKDFLKLQLKSMQRIYKVTPRYDRYNAIQALMNDGLDSALSIAQMGQTNFVENYGEKLFNYWQARAIHANACQTAATTLNLFAKYSPAFDTGFPKVTNGQSDVVKDIPDWQTLFGPLSLCECQHCRSVLSPAAYLVDLLNFLNKHNLEGKGTLLGGTPITVEKPALERLLQRRPDIGNLELSCENTNTPVPYVDLLNEVLENTVSSLLFTIDDPGSKYQKDLDEGIILENKDFVDAFKSNQFSLSTTDAFVEVEEVGKNWLIKNPGWNFNLLNKDGTKLEVVVTPQTYGTPEATSANPEHPNKGAYEMLARQIYPWDLPFNLWIEEARAYLNHLGVPRYQLMETFHKYGKALTQIDIDIACERLDLTPFQKYIINGGFKVRAATTEQITLFGSQTIDMVVLVDGDLVLVKNQINDTENGIYVAKKNAAWERSEDVTHDTGTQKSMIINVKEGNDNLDTYWLYTGTTSGELEIAELKLWEFWGFKTELVQDLFVPANTVNWDVALKHVPTFLKKSGLSYKELLDLLKTKYINPKGKIEIVFVPGAGDSCNLELATIEDLIKSDLSKIHRYVRLWRKMGWDIYDLDKITAAINPADLNDDFLLKLSYIQRLHTDLKVPLIKVLSWWFALDTETYSSETTCLYDQLFLNKAVVNPEDDVFLLNGDRSELQAYLINPNNPPKISEHKPSVLAAMGMSDSDLSLLIGQEVDDILSLVNLSHLYRIKSFSQALKLSIREYLSLEKLSGLNPFDATHIEATLQFVELVRKIQASDFRIAELDYLLRHVYNETEGIAPVATAIALILGEIRTGLQKIAVENIITPDPNGELTKSKLVLLKWEESSIQKIIATLNGIAVYEALLGALPAGLIIPEKLKDKLWYDADRKILSFKGIMSEKEKKYLLSLSPSSSYASAIDALFNAPRNFTLDRMKAFEFPVFRVTLLVIPDDLIFPETLKDKIYYDAKAKELCFIGWMSEAEKTILPGLSQDAGYQAAITELNDKITYYSPQEENEFLDVADVQELFKEQLITPITPEQRFATVLNKLIPYLCKILSKALVKQKLGDALKLDAKIIEQLLVQWVNSPFTATEKAMSEFLAQDFVAGHPDLEITLAAFPNQFNTFIMLQKIATIISKLKIDAQNLPLLFQKDQTVWANEGWLDLNELPLSVQNGASSLFMAMEKMIDLCFFRNNLLPGEPSLFEILNMVFKSTNYTEADLFQALSQRTGWNLEELQYLTSQQGFDFTFPGDYKKVQVLNTLNSCFKLMQRLGVAAKETWDWSRISTVTDDEYLKTRSIKQTVKAKYEDEQWLTIAKPLRDPLREKQRSALVSYLVYDNGLNNVNDLYALLLIDVEMSPCMMISRIKLAISSVQLFIQRCIMNLETWKIPTASQVLEWKQQWSWMKNYRVWEANRKVFLYPENWIEPELRDNKSPFFKDLENELLQNEVTDDNVEKAFLNYLEQLDQVAHLEICAMYNEIETDAKNNVGQVMVRRMHVFGRTQNGDPRIYYYRQLEDTSLPEYAEWTPWERVDVDIQGDHLIPVIWNRRLYLFWPIFTERSMTAKQGQTKEEIDSDNIFEAGLVEAREGIDKATEWILDGRAALDVYYSVDSDDEERKDARFHRVAKAVALVCHGLDKIKSGLDNIEKGLGEELTDSKNGLDDAYKGHRSITPSGAFSIKNVASGLTEVAIGITKIKEELERLEEQDNGIREPIKYWEIKIAWSELRNGKWSAKKVSNESINLNKVYDPRHGYPNQSHQELLISPKSTFFFRGRIENDNLIITCMQSWPDWSSDWPSRQIIASFNFYSFFSCSLITYHSWYEINDEGDVVESTHMWRALPRPNASHVEFMTFVEDEAENPLELATGELDNSGVLMEGTQELIPVLQRTPGTFKILFPHEIYYFISQASFFYHDDYRKFFIIPLDKYLPGDDGKVHVPEIDIPQDSQWNEVPGLDHMASILDGYYANIRVFDFWDQFSPQSIFEINWSVTWQNDLNNGKIPGELGQKFAQKGISLTPDASASPFQGEAGRWLIHDAGTIYTARIEADQLHIYENPAPAADPLTFAQTYAVPGSAGADVGVDTGYQSQFPGFGSWSKINMLLQAQNSQLSLISKVLTVKASEDQYEKQFLFRTYYHPYVCKFIEHLNREGIKGLLQLPVQQELKNRDFFETDYGPTDYVIKTQCPVEDVDFEYNGAYSLYNWELFFHAPLLIADRLSKNQKFEEAQKWFHYIFDPTASSDLPEPQKYWRVLPFFDNEDSIQSIQDIMSLLQYEGSDKDKQDEKLKLEKLIEDWEKDPFKPHLIARLRRVAYQKTVVMKYLDNLVAWADQLFRRDTIESINEATQLYILAAEILGKRPESIPPRGKLPTKTFNQLPGEPDAFSNYMVQLENSIPASCMAAPLINTETQFGLILGASVYLSYTNKSDGEKRLYFCIPKNEKLLSYWDTVDDRLFKIRHCMNIEGVERELPLWEPPIDPALLVRAVAAGVDISSVLNDLYAPLPHYRFQFMLQKAIEFCSEVRSLGASLLSALEKKDAEELALLRSTHEKKLLEAVKVIKENQIEEAKETLNGMNKSLEATNIRYNYYKNIDFMNSHEKAQLDMIMLGTIIQLVGQFMQLAGSSARAIPDVEVGVSGMGGHSTVKQGGSQIGAALEAFSQGLMMQSSLINTGATLSSIMGGHHRHKDEWKLQEDIASKEIEQINMQISAADIRREIAEKDLENHNLQTENAEEIDEYMRNKFTNIELYNWMISQISSVYFQSYQMAYDLAKRAERAFQYELGEYDTSFIKFGYWDSLKKGLLAGEKLHYDLKRMEVAYLEKNKREYEITRHISLAMFDPMALVMLKETGECFFNLSETLFDLDYPGHYFRRIKSVSMTIPCVTGPYTSVNSTLTLMGNSIRIKPGLINGEYAKNPDNDSRFMENVGAIQSIATSSGQNDSGLFELNFRDERYLPFEGAGVISQWHLELPKEFRSFNYDTITDVIFHINYTAREGGARLKQAVETELTDLLNQMASANQAGLWQILSAKHEFSAKWHRFLSTVVEDDPANPEHQLELDLSEMRLPYPLRNKNAKLNSIIFFLKLNDETVFDSYDDSNPLKYDLINNGVSEVTDGEFKKVMDGKGNKIKNLLLAVPYEHQTKDPGTRSLEIATDKIPGCLKDKDIDRLKADVIEDLLILFQYSIGS